MVTLVPGCTPTALAPGCRTVTLTPGLVALADTWTNPIISLADGSFRSSGVLLPLIMLLRSARAAVLSTVSFVLLREAIAVMSERITVALALAVELVLLIELASTRRAVLLMDGVLLNELIVLLSATCPVPVDCTLSGVLDWLAIAVSSARTTVLVLLVGVEDWLLMDELSARAVVLALLVGVELLLLMVEVSARPTVDVLFVGVLDVEATVLLSARLAVDTLFVGVLLALATVEVSARVTVLAIPGVLDVLLIVDVRSTGPEDVDVTLSGVEDVLPIVLSSARATVLALLVGVLDVLPTVDVSARATVDAIEGVELVELIVLVSARATVLVLLVGVVLALAIVLVKARATVEVLLVGVLLVLAIVEVRPRTVPAEIIGIQGRAPHEIGGLSSSASVPLAVQLRPLPE